MVTLAEIKQLIKEGYSEAFQFRKILAAAVTAERLTEQKEDICMMRVKAFSTNGGLIYVGFNSGLSAANGYELAVSEAIDIYIDRADKVWICTNNATDGVQVICYK